MTVRSSGSELTHSTGDRSGQRRTARGDSHLRARTPRGLLRDLARGSKPPAHPPFLRKCRAPHPRLALWPLLEASGPCHGVWGAGGALLATQSEHRPTMTVRIMASRSHLFLPSAPNPSPSLRLSAVFANERLTTNEVPLHVPKVMQICCRSTQGILIKYICFSYFQQDGAKFFPLQELWVNTNVAFVYMNMNLTAQS